MAIANHERIGKALELLRAGLGPFVEREVKNAFNANTSTRMAAYLGDDKMNSKKCPRRKEH